MYAAASFMTVCERNFESIANKTFSEFMISFLLNDTITEPGVTLSRLVGSSSGSSSTVMVLPSGSGERPNR